MRKTIAIDFDGCICTDNYPKIGLPNWEIIEQAKKERSMGAGLILWTCREGKLLDEALNACKKWGLNFDAVNKSLPEWVELFGNNPRKIGATEYWDDKAIKKPEGTFHLDKECWDWCGYCEDNIRVGIPLNWQYGLDHILLEYSYCPMCGKPLTDKALSKLEIIVRDSNNGEKKWHK